MGRAATLALARRATRFLLKVGEEILRFDAKSPLPDAQIEAYLVHDDGFLRVPVLMLDDLLVRGFTEELYAEALEAEFGRGGAR